MLRTLPHELPDQLDPNAELLLESSEITYDFDRDLIVATGNVQVYYDGNTVQAHQIIFDRKSQQLKARRQRDLHREERQRRAHRGNGPVRGLF